MPRNLRETTYRRPLDLRHVVDAAAARLEESWISPDPTGFMMTSGLAEEFAATLCAYGMAAAETDHMHEAQAALQPRDKEELTVSAQTQTAAAA